MKYITSSLVPRPPHPFNRGFGCKRGFALRRKKLGSLGTRLHHFCLSGTDFLHMLHLPASLFLFIAGTCHYLLPCSCIVLYRDVHSRAASWHKLYRKVIASDLMGSTFSRFNAEAVGEC